MAVSSLAASTWVTLSAQQQRRAVTRGVTAISRLLVVEESLRRMDRMLGEGGGAAGPRSAELWTGLYSDYRLAADALGPFVETGQIEAGVPAGIEAQVQRMRCDFGSALVSRRSLPWKVAENGGR